MAGAERAREPAPSSRPGKSAEAEATAAPDVGSRGPARSRAAGTPAAGTREELAARAAWLKERVRDAITNIAGKRRTYRLLGSGVRLITILLTGAMTVCLGLDVPADSAAVLKSTALIAGVVVTMLNALEPLFNFRQLWVEHEEAKYRMHRVQDRLAYLLAGGDDHIDPDALEALRSEYTDAWDALSTRWLKARRSLPRQEPETYGRP